MKEIKKVFNVEDVKNIEKTHKVEIKDVPKTEAVKKTEIAKTVKLFETDVVFKDANNKKMIEIVSAYCLKGGINKESVIDSIFAHCKKIGFTKNNKGKDISRETVAQMLNSVTRLIGKGTEKRFNIYTVTKTDTEFKWVLKPVLAPVIK